MIPLNISDVTRVAWNNWSLPYVDKTVDQAETADRIKKKKKKKNSSNNSFP